MDHRTTPLPELVRRWQARWGLCRRLDPAVEDRGALHARLDLPGRHREVFVLDPDALPGLAAEVAASPEPTWLSVPTEDPAHVTATVTATGLEVPRPPQWFMTTTLDTQPTRPTPGGYTVDVFDAGRLVHVRVLTDDGTQAARGMAGIDGTDAVAHDISTEPAHRRRGLGGVVMTALRTAALDRGATTGLLIATPDGERLYTVLGWTTRAALVTARNPEL